VNYFERFGKLFFKKVFQGLDFALSLTTLAFAPDERARARPRTQTRASREYVRVKALKSIDIKEQGVFHKPRRGFR
jgi:hypothetical protein